MFKITERQYNIIMKQAQACFPQETGGFLGGHGETILGVLPIPNKNLGDRTQTFALTSDDLDLAFRFLVKHQLEFLGVYHTHPGGIPVPSAQDLSHRQKYLFIVGLKDRYNPELFAWRVEGDRLYPEDIKIVSDLGATVIDIRTGKPQLAQGASAQQLDRLAEMIDGLVAGRLPEYPKFDPQNWDASSFSTLA
ncbi:MAG: M67 family metallopeptidase [Candidatus Margulisbacteria bacterium]|jgi:proteasome lid subunit RPN8/RPN11|nr:M67 family metallopeptidase [Candidatus Margulisiibacteriota bacterium]